MTREKRAMFWLGGFALFLISLYLLRSILLPFVAGMAVAYFLDPVADRLERSGLGRTAATSLITLAFFLIVVLLLVLLAPIINDQIINFVQRVPGYAQALIDRAQPLLVEIEHYLSPKDVERVRNAVGEYAGSALGLVAKLAGEVLSGSFALLNLLSLVFITPIVTFYMLRDWDTMVAKVDSWLPRRHLDTIRAQFKEIDRTLAGFVRGQATVCLALGTIYGVGLTAAGLELGLIVGLVSGLVSFIPYLGTISGFVVGIGLAVAQQPGWQLPLTVAGIFIVGQVIEGNFLTPRLVGNRVGLHPVWVMFALLAFGALFGFVGLLLAVPVSASIGVIARFSLQRYLHSSLYRHEQLGQDLRDL